MELLAEAVEQIWVYQVSLILEILPERKTIKYVLNSSGAEVSINTKDLVHIFKFLIKYIHGLEQNTTMFITHTHIYIYTQFLF